MAVTLNITDLIKFIREWGLRDKDKLRPFLDNVVQESEALLRDWERYQIELYGLLDSAVRKLRNAVNGFQVRLNCCSRIEERREPNRPT